MSIIASVVIPTYCRPQLLHKCLEALLQQQFDRESYEIIVVSDGPDDETKKEVEQFAGYDKPKVRYIALPVKKGPAAARNLGWQSAKGYVIAFTDDDCLPQKTWLQNMVNNCAPGQEIALTGKVVVPFNSERPTDYELNTANLQTAEFITANCACAKTVLEKTGGFDEEFSMAWREDSDLHFRLLSKGIPIKRVGNAIVVHPVRSALWGVSIKEQKKTMYDALLYKKHPKLFRKRIRPVSPYLYYAIVVAFVLMLSGMIFQEQNLTITGGVAWLSFTVLFIYKRLNESDLSPKHVAEMVVTSLFIPFLSVYWQWYGAVKYRVLFI
ncbi:glycosyltransferase family 2 protein [Mucilaginibacter terrae]|uniref:Glycosyltransferase involved in cell wall biosynthesis n=1 Tax=Mucilaginibacter terrae TaxID=1955052 RepID=A0ABU3GZV6_9SPHI|nr:glycosyltransferase [Mucilaginibacter terrae]MDT3405301.1 glycosyltransferase involved in cell wall biosynthesis [Mucilaginibacter terrae]